MKRNYVPDLVKQSVICEMNYARLLKLLPAEFEARDYRICWHQNYYIVQIRRDEEFAYTSTMTLSYWPETASPWFDPQALVIRLYHDARLAEVVCMKRRKQLQGRYDYPNPEMHQPDEKFQVNQYLAEWLGQCLTSGGVTLPKSLVC